MWTSNLSVNPPIAGEPVFIEALVQAVEASSNINIHSITMITSSLIVDCLRRT